MEQEASLDLSTIEAINSVFSGENLLTLGVATIWAIDFVGIVGGLAFWAQLSS